MSMTDDIQTDYCSGPCKQRNFKYEVDAKTNASRGPNLEKDINHMSHNGLDSLQ